MGIFDVENEFILKCDSSRIAKLIAHWTLFKNTNDIPGKIVECGVFKGNCLMQMGMFKQITNDTRELIGFDVFGKYPSDINKEDKELVDVFISNSGGVSNSKEELQKLFDCKGIEVELVVGDICNTVPEYVKKHPELRISLLHVDVDLYEPSITSLKYLYPLVTKGGIIILDDYSYFPGETRAIDEYFDRMNIRLKKFSESKTPSYFIKR